MSIEKNDNLRPPRFVKLLIATARAIAGMWPAFLLCVSLPLSAQKNMSFESNGETYPISVSWVVKHNGNPYPNPKTDLEINITKENEVSVEVQFTFNSNGLPADDKIVWGCDVSGNSPNIRLTNTTLKNRSPKRYVIFKASKGNANLTIFPRVWKRDGSTYTEITQSEPIALTFNFIDDTQTANPVAPVSPSAKPQSSTSTKKPVQTVVVSEEEKAFNEAKQIEDTDKRGNAFKGFVAKYGAKNPKSEWVAQALRASPLGYNQPVNNNDGTYSYDFTNALNPEVDTTGLVAMQLEPTGFAAFRLTFKPKNDSLDQVKVADKGKDAPYNNLKKLKFKERIIVTLLGQDSDSFRIKVNGGTPPFIVFLSQNGFPRERYEITETGKVFAFSKDACKLCENGAHTLEVYDSENSTQLFAGTEADAIIIEKPNYILNFLKIVGILLILTFVIVRIRQARQKRLYEEKLRQKKLRQPEPEPEIALPPVEPPAPTKIITNQDLDRLQEKLSDPEVPELPKMAIKIKSDSKTRTDNARRKFINADAMNAMLRDNKHYSVDCLQIWPDSALTRIYLSQHSITGLDRFLRTQNIHEITEADNMVPEIGGFLLGLIHEDETQKTYEVFVEEFIPISPETHNTFRLEFSTESLVNDLGDIQDKYPNSGLLAWFHTHPGHGLFLSSPDLAIHEGFFKENYQFAMIIDSLSPDLDTGFFTRKMSSEINNQDNQAADEKWLAWTEIEKTIRRKDS